LVEEVTKAKLPIRFLLISNNLTHKADYTTLLIYQKQEGLSRGYIKHEFKVSQIEQVADVVKKWLRGERLNSEIVTNITRDILVCTHGSYDKCCARYGNSFYFHANANISQLNVENVRIWQSTHIGGHRFAPTAIDLPEGRYYGLLDQDSFQAILTRTGDIQTLKKVYRGWGILPPAIQVLERDLMLSHGWNWFNYKVAGKILEQSLDNNTLLGELTFEQGSSQYIYQAKLIKDNTRTIEVHASCNGSQPSKVVKYAVANLWLLTDNLLSFSK
jgi:hypothetical protein